MRTHSRHARLAARIDPETFHRVVNAGNLVAGRLDPGYATRMDAEGLLDLIFADEANVAIVPYVGVQGIQLLIPEKSPFIWPSWLPRLRRNSIYEIEELVLPWLRSLVIARCTNEESVRFFGTNTEAHALFERAREAGFQGAAPTEDVMRSLAPYVFALRFAAGRTVLVSDAGGANGAAVLARVAARVDVDLGDTRRAELARRWFGIDAFDRRPDAARYDVAIGAAYGSAEADVTIALHESAGARTIDVAMPIPPSVMVSFDAGEGSSGQRFSVSAPAMTHPAPALGDVPVLPGSAGRIGLILRDDYIDAEDADVDAARALADRLAHQGFTPSIVPAFHLYPRDFDLLHVFGLRCASSIKAALERAGNPSLPLVVSPYADDAAGEAEWGASISRTALENAADDLLRGYYFAAIRDRNLEAPSVAKRGSNLLRDEPDVQYLVRRANAMVATCAEEAAILRGSFGFAGPMQNVPALLGVEGAGADVASLVGSSGYVLVHAPIEPRCNQFALVRAATALGFPLVIAGPVRDVIYYNDVVAVFGDTVAFLPEEGLTEAELAELYRGARVYADASWMSGGLYRVARAAANGVAIVVPTSGYARSVWPTAVLVDPASHASVSDGLRLAWEEAPRLGGEAAARSAEVCHPFGALRTLLTVYQAAAAEAGRGQVGV